MMNATQLGLTPIGGSPLRRLAVGLQPAVVYQWVGELPGADIASTGELLAITAAVHVNTRSDDPNLQKDGLVRRRCWLPDGEHGRTWFWIVLPERMWLAGAEPGEYALDLEVELQADGTVLVRNHVAFGDSGPRPVISAG